MKPFVITALWLLAATLLNAQQTPSPDRKTDLLSRLQDRHKGLLPPGADGRVYRWPGKDTAGPERFKQLLDAERLTRGGLITATFSHDAPRGKVYNLSPDNMPCLVPYTRRMERMPNGFKGMPKDSMNVWRKQKIVP